MSTGSNKTLANSFYANGKLFAGFPCKIGHNAAHSTYSKGTRCYYDLFKQSSAWSEITGSPVFNSDGWITDINGGVAKKYLIVNNDNADYQDGNYTITWTGTASIDVANRTVNVVSANEINFDLPAGLTGIAIYLTISGSVGQNFEDAKCYLTADAANILAGDIWRPEYTALFADNSHIRMMDLQLTNSSTIREIEDGSTLNSSTWSNGKGMGGYGVPPEALAELCNVVGVDGWINIPHLAKDATKTDFITRFNNTLDAGLKCFIEDANESWNSQSDFRCAFRHYWHGLAPTLDATLSGGIFTNVDGSGTPTAHGMTTGDTIITHNTPYHQTAPWGDAEYMYVIVRSTDTFEVALSNADALADTVATPPSTIKKLVYKHTSAYSSAGNIPVTNYGILSRATWALTDAVMTRARGQHVTGLQSTNSGRTAILMDATHEAATDFCAIAPYADYTDLTDYHLASNAEILAHLKASGSTLKSQIRAHFAYTNKPILCYEGGDETYTSTQAEKDKTIEFYNSDEMLELYPWYGTLLANCHLREINFFHSHGGVFGTQFTTNDTTSTKWLSIQPFMTTGFYRGTL